MDLGRHRWKLSALFLAAGLLLVISSSSQAQPSANSSSLKVRLASSLKNSGVKVYRRRRTGQVRLVGATKAKAIERPAGLPANAPPEVAARAYLRKYGPLFGIPDQSEELAIEHERNLAGGRSAVKFRQEYEGVPVIGGELNVETDGSNKLLSAAGETLPNLRNTNLATNPSVEAGPAARTALARVAEKYNEKEADLRASAPKLEIFSPEILGVPGGTQQPVLVWQTEVTPEKGVVDLRVLVFVDAGTGRPVLDFNQLDTARDRLTYDANSTSTLPGALVCDESNPCTSTSYDKDVRLAHEYAADTYDFYKNVLGRDSVDGAGLTLKSTADYCDPQSTCPYRNAYWSGTQMVYGDGFASADDVVGHELTHGVTQYTSNLYYYGQSGAINESLSDVFGEFIDQTNGSGTDTQDVKWLLGEDIPGGAIRDTKDPTRFGDPDSLTSPNYYSGSADNGGVHTDSGVDNKAAYLMTDGDTFNGYTVTGLGVEKVARIYYEAQTSLLTSASDYQDLHADLPQACSNLVGISNITADDCRQVQSAVDATMSLPPSEGVTLTSPVNGSTVSGPNVPLSAVAAGRSEVEFLVNGNVVGTDTTPNGDSYSLSWNSQNVPDGRYPVVARAHDAAGNLTDSGVSQVVVDNFYPETRITFSPPQAVRTARSRARVTFKFSSPDADVAGFQCSLDGRTFASCASPKVYRVVRGRHTFRVRAVGSAGAATDADPTPAVKVFRVVRR